METVPQLLESAARWAPDHPLVITPDSSYTYGEIDIWANRIAQVLIERGIRPGDPVALHLPSRPIFVAAYYGTMKAGAVAAPLNAMFTAGEVAAMVDYLGASTVITTADLVATTLEAGGTLEQALDVLVWPDEHEAVDGAADLRALAAAAPGNRLEVLPDPDSVAAVFHTSGTTGRPKGAAQTHANIVLGGRALSDRAGWRRGREVVSCPLPLFNNFGSTAVLNMVTATGGTLALVERWDVEAVLQTFQTGATQFVGTPTMYIYLLQSHDPAVHGEFGLDGGIVGGQTCPPEVSEGIHERFGFHPVNLYGATETHAATTTTRHGRHPVGTVGHPVGSVTIRIEDDGGTEVAAGKIGEVVIDSDSVCAGYWRDPERTTESFGPHGWRSGDLGYVDDAGYLFVVDRKKDLIICGGANIYPAEIEAVLYTHPSVAMATVIGLPDPVKGEIPTAYVVRAARCDPVSADDLRTLLRSQLAAYKCPRAFEFVDALPTSAVGKILKRELRDQVTAASSIAR